ncbi:O-antigen ligase family protein [Nonomuraea sp. NBC_01738]|uniref:O-antigen ligase family protein n=1 Tax=Nonomuraea sp. NBC_01738 TaxID=2976003 RepID=UPI002E125D10|nr:O-antigen ligase family protein [Nonomuraea sp. NBC_01738]
MALGFKPLGTPSSNGHRPKPPVVVDLHGEPVDRRADAATVAALFAVVQLVTPAALILRGLPLSITPAAVIGLVGIVLWMLAQFTTNLGAAKGRNPIRTAVFLFFVANLVSYGYATYGYLPSDEINLADNNLVLLLANLGVALLVCDGVRGLARLDLVLKGAVVAGAIIGMVGAVQFVTGFDPTRYMVLPGLRLSWEDLYVFERGSVRRVSATTAHPIEFGVICAMLLPIAFHYAVKARALAKPYLRWWVCTGLIGAGLMFSVSRSAVLSMLGIGVVLMAGWPRKRRWQALGALAGFLVVMKVAVPGLLGTFFDLFADFFTDSSIQYRTHDYSIAVAEIERHLWLGRATGTWYVPKYQVFDNQYIQSTIDTGLIGVAIYAGMLICAVVVGLRARSLSADPHARDLALTLAAVMVAPILASATFDLLSFATVAGLTFLLVGAVGALLRAVREENQPMHSSGPVSAVTR